MTEYELRVYFIGGEYKTLSFGEDKKERDKAFKALTTMDFSKRVMTCNNAIINLRNVLYVTSREIEV